MSKTKISEFSSDPALNTDIDGINIAEGCAPSGINNAIRELMAQLKDWQSGTSLDTFNTNYMVATAVDINGGAIDGAVIGANSAAAATFTTATATTFNATTVDSTSIEVTNIKAKDGTAAGSIADSTGVVTLASSVLTTTDINGGTIDNTTIGGSTPAVGSFTQANVDNLRLDGNTLSSTNSNGAINLTPNGTGQVTVTNDALVSGLTVGKGAGAVSTNTAVGASALAANTSGAYNTALGNLALNANQSGSGNVAIGFKAGTATLNNFNTAVGSGFTGFTKAALEDNTTGAYNIGIGSGALGSNTTASNNTAVGYQAGYSNTTGGVNAFFGDRAGYSATTGVGNTFIGQNAGYSVTTGVQNTFVGHNTDGSAAGSNVTTGSKNTILGGYNGNQGGLDIRTANNYIVLSDGDGDPAFYVVPSNINGSIDGRYFVAAKTLGSSANLNDIFKPGMYRVDSGASNTPTTNFYALNVYGNAGNVTTQLATVLAGTDTYVRSYNTSWSAWVQL